MKHIKYLLVAVAVIFLIGIVWYGYGRFDIHQRHAEVAARGAHVMPFELDETSHIFQKTTTGGLQQVTANDQKNTKQIDLIRTHLLAETQKFQRGDFSSPAKIHGADMPGLAELSEGVAQINIRYVALPAGGEIHYTTSEPNLIAAIHRWFDAQVADHGAHASIPRLSN